MRSSARASRRSARCGACSGCCGTATSELALAPQPSLARIDDLAASLTETGLPVEVRVEGTPVDLPPGIDVTAYRIVQEALTNTLKHAGPARAPSWSFATSPARVELEVLDDGPARGATATAPATG